LPVPARIVLPLEAQSEDNLKKLMRLTAKYLAVLSLALPAFFAGAQEAVRNVENGDAAATTRAAQMESPTMPEYTFKDGDFTLLALPSATLEWNDNIYLTRSHTDDFIVRPAVALTASYPLTDRNLLFVDISIGYDWYLQHQSLSTFELNSSSGTGLSFDLAVKDFNFNFHDWISYVQDASQTPNAANTANYGTFRNVAGVTGTWELSKSILSLGYDHENILATSSQFNRINHSAEMLNARAGLKIHPRLTVGVEATAAFTTYEQTILNNNDAYTAGGYAEYKPGKAFSLTARGGFSTYQFQQTSTAIRTGNANSWYGSVLLAHQPRESVAYQIEAGHEVQFGINSDLLEDWYVRPTVTWRFIRNLDFTTGLFYENGKQGVSNVSGNLAENFNWYGGQISLRHRLTKRFEIGALYRLTLRASNQASQSYTQNLVGIQLTYHPQ
jgi:Putative beta-barrel porin 2